MWKESSKPKSGNAMRKWTRKKTARRSGSKADGADNEVDIDQLFS